eukprot:6507-Eustigmatos_ZCMA.PRE.1
MANCARRAQRDPDGDKRNLLSPTTVRRAWHIPLFTYLITSMSPLLTIARSSHLLLAQLGYVG